VSKDEPARKRTRWCECPRWRWHARALRNTEELSSQPRAPWLFSPFAFNRIEPLAQRDETWWLIKDGERANRRQRLVKHLKMLRGTTQDTCVLWVVEFDDIIRVLEESK
jgi:hypothetical protein